MIKSILKKIAFAFVIALTLMSCTNKHRQKLQINELVERIAPQFADDIVFEHITSPNGKDVFELESLPNGKVKISGNSCIAMATGFNHYLKYYCKTSVSWFVDQHVQLPEKMPLVPEKVKKEAKVNRRFFLNYCTSAYTMPWWQWKDWERLIDWMALNGVNLPLAVNGQETVWYKVWRDYGLTDQQIREYFTGPAHLPFNRMSVLDKWDSPLLKSWMDYEQELQHKILKRERALGMKPVLQAFGGHVPPKLKEKYPKAKITKLEEWGGFSKAYSSNFLDPVDPLFKKIQKAYLEEQTKIFGTDHLYAADPFVEVPPTSWNLDSLSNISENIYFSMSEVDPEAEWLQMSWAFFFIKDWTGDRINAFVNGPPKGKMTVLDYFCDYDEFWKKTESFYGQPYIWCYLGNFGGNTMLAGNLDDINNKIDNALAYQGSTLSGVAGVMEGLDVNPLMYEFVFEKAWGSDHVDLKEWMNKWADRRCGMTDANARKAWNIILDKVYTKMPRLSMGTLTNGRPALTGYGKEGWNAIMDMVNPDIATADLYRAWELLLKTKDKNRDTFQYDVVNIGRQVLADHFLVLRDNFTADYNKKDIESMKVNGTKMLEILYDLDRLLATHTNFLLGDWIEDARKIGKNDTEADYFEKNARNIITTWGGKNSVLTDYANRNWAGLTKSYYAGRWKVFIDEVIRSTEKGEPFDEDAFKEKVVEFEWDWVGQKEKYPTQPVGNSVETAKQLLEKYRTQIAK